MAGQAEPIETENPALGDDPNAGKAPESPQLRVDLSEGDEDEAEPGAAQPKEGRRERRSRKVSELSDELKSEREKRTTMERELAELRGRVSAIQAMPVTQQSREDVAPSDPMQQQIDSLESQQEAILVQMRSADLPDAQVDVLRKQYKQLGRQLRQAEYRQIAAGDRGEAPASRSEYENQMLASEFPEVFGDPIRLQEAKTELVRLNRTRGLPYNYASAKMAAQMIRDRYTKRAPAPSAADKAKLASEPGRAGAGGAGNIFAPSKLHLNAARAFTAHQEGLTDEQRVKIWALKVGKPRGLI